MFTTLFVVSSVSISTRGLESSLNVAHFLLALNHTTGMMPPKTDN
jgi:hypothetical protein